MEIFLLFICGIYLWINPVLSNNLINLLTDLFDPNTYLLLFERIKHFFFLSATHDVVFTAEVEVGDCEESKARVQNVVMGLLDQSFKFSEEDQMDQFLDAGNYHIEIQFKIKKDVINE